MKMRRFLAMLISVLMVLTLFPAAALADTETLVPEAAPAEIFTDSSGMAWRVLHVDGAGNRLMITERIHDWAPHSVTFGWSPFSQSNLRTVLNGWTLAPEVAANARTPVGVDTDVRSAPGDFNRAENEAVGRTTAGPRIPAANAVSGLFVLSISEVNQYFDNRSFGVPGLGVEVIPDRQARSAYLPADVPPMLWWLRSPGSGDLLGTDMDLSHAASIVGTSGVIQAWWVNYHQPIGIRPAMWVDAALFGGGGGSVDVQFFRNYTGAANNGLFYDSTVRLGETLAPPTAGNPARAGYTFEGWYLEPTNETRKGFNVPVTEAMLSPQGTLRLYARWALDTDFHAWFIQGDHQGNFRPIDNITRADVAAILVRTMGGEVDLRTPPAMPFPDVAPARWFFPYVAWAAELGFIRGDEHGNFNPDAPVSRQELAAMTARAADLEIAPAGTIDFPDGCTTTAWARDYVYAVVSAGWLQGDGDGNLRPLDCIVRAEATAVILRALERTSTTTASLVDVRDDLRLFPDVRAGQWYYYLVIEASHSHRFVTTTVAGQEIELWTEVTWP